MKCSLLKLHAVQVLSIYEIQAVTAASDAEMKKEIFAEFCKKNLICDY